jgi:hypothetical protein
MRWIISKSLTLPSLSLLYPQDRHQKVRNASRLRAQQRTLYLAAFPITLSTYADLASV